MSKLTDKRNQAKPFDVNHQRRRDIAHLVVARHGKLANAALCIPYAIAAAWHCPTDSERRFLMVQWCRWVCAARSVERQIDAILAANPPRRIGADTLARHLAVSDAERTGLRIWTIGSFDMPKAKRIKRRKDNRRRAAQARRLANGGKLREEALSRTKPWEAFGIKRRAWEYRGKPDPAVAQIRSQTHCANSRPRESSTLPSGYEFAQLAPQCLDQEQVSHHKQHGPPNQKRLAVQEVFAATLPGQPRAEPDRARLAEETRSIRRRMTDAKHDQNQLTQMCQMKSAPAETAPKHRSNR
jgi:hypothetical protein